MRGRIQSCQDRADSRLLMCYPGTRVGAENFKGGAGACEHFVSLMKSDVLAGMHGNPASLSHLRDPRFHGATVRIRIPVIVYGASTTFLHQCLQHCALISSLANDQPATCAL